MYGFGQIHLLLLLFCIVDIVYISKRINTPKQKRHDKLRVAFAGAALCIVIYLVAGYNKSDASDDDSLFMYSSYPMTRHF